MDLCAKVDARLVELGWRAAPFPNFPLQKSNDKPIAQQQKQPEPTKLEKKLATVATDWLGEWQDAWSYLDQKYRGVPDGEYGPHMAKLDPLRDRYFSTTSSFVDGFFDLEAEEWIETDVVLVQRTVKKQAPEKLAIDMCDCCRLPIVVQQDMRWICWYCSDKNTSAWRHPCKK